MVRRMKLKTLNEIDEACLGLRMGCVDSNILREAAREWIKRFKKDDWGDGEEHGWFIFPRYGHPEDIEMMVGFITHFFNLEEVE